MSVRIREVELTGDSFTPTLRVGWLSDDFAVFSRWKRVRHSIDRDGNVTWKLGWKSSLVKWVSKSTETIAIVLFQKVGETEFPVAKREIPCRQVLNGQPGQKYKFRRLPLQELKGNARGTLSGWVRFDEDFEESSELHGCGMTVEKVSTLSHFSTLAQASVDMSIDLTMGMLGEYYPFIIDPFINSSPASCSNACPDSADHAPTNTDCCTGAGPTELEASWYDQSHPAPGICTRMYNEMIGLYQSCTQRCGKKKELTFDFSQLDKPKAAQHGAGAWWIQKEN